MNTIKLVLVRDGKMACIVVRSDEAKPIGSKFKWGPGKCWIVKDRS